MGRYVTSGGSTNRPFNISGGSVHIYIGDAAPTPTSTPAGPAPPTPMLAPGPSSSGWAGGAAAKDPRAARAASVDGMVCPSSSSNSLPSTLLALGGYACSVLVLGELLRVTISRGWLLGYPMVRFWHFIIRRKAV